MNETRKNEFQKDTNTVSAVGIFGNLILTVFKALAGIVGHSSAMVSDAVHSASDVLSTIIAMIGVRISGKQDDVLFPDLRAPVRGYLVEMSFPLFAEDVHRLVHGGTEVKVRNRVYHIIILA